MSMNNGKQTKKGNEGGISSNILLERFFIFSKSLVSKYIQMIASKEVNGIEAIRPAMIVDLLDISETTTTKTDVINIYKPISI